MANLPSDHTQRAYRKALCSEGVIYLGFIEHKMKVINLSLTGLLAELNSPNASHDVKSIFRSLQASSLVDIFLPTLRIAGEAEVVRAEATERGVQLAIEFRNLSHDIDNLLYSRRAYRKNMTALGQLIFDGIEYSFATENVSVDGLMAHIHGTLDIDAGTIVHFVFKHWEIQGDAEVVWSDHDFNTTLLGLKYIHLERGDFRGIPNFNNPENI